MTIDFGFAEEQRALAATARELFEKESPPSRLRAVWEGAERDPRVWKTMADVGLVGVMIAEEFGGMGGDEVDMALVLEEVGRAALPEPLAEVAVAARALDDADLLRGIAAGDVVAVISAAELAPDADLAQIAIVDDIAHRTFSAGRVPSLDHGRRLFRVTPTGDGTPVAPTGARVAWATACVLNGVSMRLLEMSIEHAKERMQFGVPIGSFQAVKHKLAAGHAVLTAARAAAHHAAYGLAHGSDDIAVAVVEAVAAHELINRDALQVHAGIGFTWEHDLHLWLKRGIALAGTLDAPAHRARLAQRLFEEDADA